MNTPHLDRTIGFWQATSLVIGSIFGTGIFLKLAKMTVLLPSVSWVMGVWIAAGLLSLAGALTYAELSSYVPKTGGGFAILYEAYGPFISFFYGWSVFCIGAPGSLAAYAVATTSFLKAILPLPKIFFLDALIPIVLIGTFVTLNSIKVKYGARFNVFITALKVFSGFFLVIGIWFFSEQNISEIFIPTETQPRLAMPAGSMQLLKAFGLAMISALWAYDGWNGLSMVGGEIRNPERNIPRALIFGMGLIIILYLLMNFSYFHVLSLTEIQNANSQFNPDAVPVAALAAEKFLNSYGPAIISIIFIISAIGGMNGSLLLGSRVPFAMAQKGLLPHKLASVQATMHTPIWAILIQGLLAMGLALTGTFDSLTETVVVSGWFFYVITISSIFVFRKRKLTAFFKIPYFPYLPLLFIFAAVLMILNSFIENPSRAIQGFVFILLGLPVYFYYHATKN